MKRKLTIFFITFFCYINTWGQTSLSTEIQTKIKNSVFEVLVEKIEDSSITYEKNLPFDRLPYSVRTDKYQPVGAAFITTDNVFYSSSTVFNLFGDSVYTDYYIRDANGKTYRIDKITSLSNTKNYISFTVPTYQKKENIGLSPFFISPAFDQDLDSIIYTVGLPQGEARIIKKGTLTDKIPESFNGDWLWIVFSSVANSVTPGAPLLNKDGNVIGIITKKDENSNLALPFFETEEGKNNKGYIDYRYLYRIPNLINQQFYENYYYDISLPLSYTELHERLTKNFKEQLKSTVTSIRSNYDPDSKKGFARTKEFASINYHSYFTPTPMILFLNESKAWTYGNKKTKKIDLGNNGFIEYSDLLNYHVFTITKPDSITLEQFITDSKNYMNPIIKLLKLGRTVGKDTIAITSLGDPIKSTTYLDYFGRTWLVNYYALKYQDSMIVTYSLVLPTGLYVIYKQDDYKSITSSHILDMGFIADHTYTNYYGMIKNWKEYLTLPESITKNRSQSEKQMKMSYSDNKLSFSAGSITLNITPDMMNYDEDTRINVQTGYYRKNNRTLMENRGLLIYTNPNSTNYTYIGVKKNPKPLSDADNTITNHWNQLIKRISPYNSKPYNSEKSTHLNDVIIKKSADGSTEEYIYELGFELINQDRNADIEKLAENVKKDLLLK